MSKVSISTVSHWVNVCRLDLDAAASTDESNDSVSALWRVTGWLRELGMSQVSHLIPLRCFVADALDLCLYRCDLNPTMSTAGSNDPNQAF